MNSHKLAINWQNFARLRLQIKFDFIIWPEESETLLLSYPYHSKNSRYKICITSYDSFRGVRSLLIK